MANIEAIVQMVVETTKIAAQAISKDNEGQNTHPE